MPVSLIATICNEGASIRMMLDTIAAQTQLPDEIVISDGGSKDNTVDILKEFQTRLPLKIIEVPGANISEGRNAAIKAATGDIIAVTDAGVRLAPNWLEELLKPFTDPQVEAVAGFFLPDPQTPFEVAMGATVLPVESDVDPERFMPSSRSVAFRKFVWEAVGGYPEWLDYSEDLILDFRIAGMYGPFVFQPSAVVYFRPRPNLRAFFKQYYLYARGDGKANLFLRRHIIRYLTYFGVLPVIIFGLLMGNPWWLAALIPGFAYMFAAAYRRLINQWGPLSWADRISAALWVPIIRVTGDIAKMIGYPGGRVWRFINHPPHWRVEQVAKDKPVIRTWYTPWLERDAALGKRLGVAERVGSLRWLAIFFTRTGDGLTFFIFMILLYLIGWFSGNDYFRSMVIIWLIADFVAFMFVQMLKTMVRRPRPVGEWGKMYRYNDPHSFPSGHSARGGVLSSISLLLVAPALGPIAMILGGLWGLMIAVSRVLLGVHYPSDTAFGYLLGITVGLIMVTVLRSLG